MCSAIKIGKVLPGQSPECGAGRVITVETARTPGPSVSPRN